MARFLKAGLKGHISKQQLESAKTNEQVCKLWLMVQRAGRGERGYGFTHKDPTKRFVYGPIDVGQ